MNELCEKNFNVFLIFTFQNLIHFLIVFKTHVHCETSAYNSNFKFADIICFLKYANLALPSQMSLFEVVLPG